MQIFNLLKSIFSGHSDLFFPKFTIQMHIMSNWVQEYIFFFVGFTSFNIKKVIEAKLNRKIRGFYKNMLLFLNFLHLVEGKQDGLGICSVL